MTTLDCRSTASNIIPDKGRMCLDIRAQDNATMDELLEKLKIAITNACAASAHLRNLLPGWRYPGCGI